MLFFGYNDLPMLKLSCCSRGFTLIELMLVVIIIAILSAIGVPQYSKYVENSKTAEAYLVIGNMIKYQTSYFSENRRFMTLQWNPLHNTRVWRSDFFWETVGYPISPGEETLFSYMTDAGQNADQKYDSATNELGAGYDLNAPLQGFNMVDSFMKATCTGGVLVDPRLEDPDYINPMTIQEAFSASNFGVIDPAPNTSEWVSIAARGNLRPGKPECRYIGITIQSVNGEAPGARGGFVQFDYNFSSIE